MQIRKNYTYYLEHLIREKSWYREFKLFINKNEYDIKGVEMTSRVERISIIGVITLFLLMMLAIVNIAYASPTNSNKACLNLTPNPIKILTETDSVTLTATLMDCTSNTPLSDKEIFWRTFDDSVVQPSKSKTDSNGTAFATYKLNISSNYYGKIQAEFLGDGLHNKSQVVARVLTSSKVYREHFLKRSDYQEAKTRYTPNYFDSIFNEEISYVGERFGWAFLFRSFPVKVHIETKGQEGIPSQNVSVVMLALSEWEWATKDSPYKVKFELVSDPAEAQIIIKEHWERSGYTINSSMEYFGADINLVPSQSGNKALIMREVGHALGIKWHTEGNDSIMGQGAEITKKDVNTLLILYSIKPDLRFYNISEQNSVWIVEGYANGTTIAKEYEQFKSDIFSLYIGYSQYPHVYAFDIKTGVFGENTRLDSVPNRNLHLIRFLVPLKNRLDSAEFANVDGGGNPHYPFKLLDKIKINVYINNKFVDAFFDNNNKCFYCYYDLDITERNFIGNTTVMLVADLDSNIDEENEENNKFTFNLINDLAVRNLNVSYLNDNSAIISWEIENIGDLTNQNIEYQVLLNDKPIESNTIPFIFGKLNPNSESEGRSKKLEFTIRNVKENGNVTVIVDPNNKIPELSKTNNIATTNFKIQQMETQPNIPTTPRDTQNIPVINPTPQTPGFEAIFSILGIGVIYCIIRTNRLHKRRF